MSQGRRTTRTRRAVSVVMASAVAVGGSALVLASQVGSASSHREAPLIAADPAADNTDTYAFVSPDDPDTTTLIANWYPNQDPAGGPNFYPWAESDEAVYTIKVDNDGDAVADIEYEWEFTNIDTRGDVVYPQGSPDEDPPLPADGSFLYNGAPIASFDDPALLFKQTYTLTAIVAGVETVLVDGAPVAPSHVGDASFPDYQALRDEAVVPLDVGVGQSFVGQAEDPFFLDLRVFDLLYGGDLSEVGYDTLAPYNVNSVALQVPTATLLNPAVYPNPEGGADIQDPTIGVWSTTDRASVTTLAADGTSTASGAFVQVSRLGNPLVNEVVFPANLKDAFNALEPANDASVELAVNKVVNPELPYLLNAVYGLDIPETPRNDLFTIFLTGVNGLNKPLSDTAQPSEVLRLNTSIPVTEEPNRLGVLAGDNQGFPNGRRLTDDVTDIALQAVAGAVTVDSDGTVGGTTGTPEGVTIVDALAAGDAVDTNNVEFSDTFPYLALPNSGSQELARVPGPETTVTETATATATETVAATETAAAPGAGTGATGPAPSGGIDTGTAATGLAPVGVALMGAVVLALGAAGYVAVTRRGRREGSV